MTSSGQYPVAQKPPLDDTITFLVYSEANSRNFIQLLGQSEYSYYFVEEEFRAMLEKRGEVVVVTEPETQVDAIYDAERAKGRECVFLAFCPPHKLPPTTRCPTVPVFAWEFDTIPTEIWDDDARNDWRTVLARTGQAITHSRYSAQAVKSAMGDDYPIESMPAPVWDRYCLTQGFSSKRTIHQTFEIELKQKFVDSEQPETLAEPPPAPAAPVSPRRRSLIERLKVKKRLGKLKRFLLKLVGRQPQLKPPVPPLPPAPPPPMEPVRLEIGGTIFLSVFNPRDGRKNWNEMLTAFCCALADCPDATLILKFVIAD